MNILRPTYMRQLIDAQNNGLIKIVSGIRRAGKSYLLKTLFRKHLIEQGVPVDHILLIDLEGMQNKAFRNPEYLLEWIDKKMQDNEPYYIIMQPWIETILYPICVANAG